MFTVNVVINNIRNIRKVALNPELIERSLRVKRQSNGEGFTLLSIPMNGSKVQPGITAGLRLQPGLATVINRVIMVGALNGS